MAQPAKVKEAYHAYNAAARELIDYTKEIRASGEWTYKGMESAPTAEEKAAGKQPTAEEQSAKKFYDRYSSFFEDYSGPNWWFFMVMIGEKLLVAIITPSLGAGTGIAQPLLLALVQCTYLGLLCWRRPFAKHADNVNHILTKINHVLVHFAFLGGAASMVSAGYDNVAEIAEGVASFVTFMQMTGTLHLLAVLAYGIYINMKPGTFSKVLPCLKRFSAPPPADAKEKGGGVHLSRREEWGSARLASGMAKSDVGNA